MKDNDKQELSQTGGDIGDSESKYNVEPWIGSWNGKRTLGENW